MGDRQTDTIEHFSPLKKKLQKLGSWVVRLASNSNVIDTTSGFRAYSRDAAMRINVVSDYTYTLETIIEAGRKKTAIENVPIRTNEKLRESRLFKSMWGYIKKSASTIIRTYSMYRPLKVFLSLGLAMFSIGFLIGVRYLYFLFNGQGDGHIQSLILASILITTGFQLGMFGLLADAIMANRKINDEMLYRMKKLQYDNFREKNMKSEYLLDEVATSKDE
ncbi:hypothetical protein [Thermohalobacter berrensis]|uniref:hypothetical protein n=1 Tax=Thermohalobacter berrensis TaxID=99594 RepID=UPI00242B336C|nr:hypothetical protein [Thermohalobacter berrensis]